MYQQTSDPAPLLMSERETLRSEQGVDVSGVHPPLPDEIPGGLPELIIGPDGRVYPATANTTTVVVSERIIRSLTRERC